MPRKSKSTRSRRPMRGGSMFYQVGGPAPFAMQDHGRGQRGAGFFDDFAKGFMMPINAVKSVLPSGTISNLAMGVNPALGIGAKILGFGRQRGGASMRTTEVVMPSGVRF